MLQSNNVHHVRFKPDPFRISRVKIFKLRLLPPAQCGVSEVLSNDFHVCFLKEVSGFVFMSLFLP